MSLLDLLERPFVKAPVVPPTPPAPSAALAAPPSNPPPPPAPPAAEGDPLDDLIAAIGAVAPDLSDDHVTQWAKALDAPMRSSGIVTVNRRAMFLGQVAHESAGLTVLSENLNYSSPDRIDAIFGRHLGDADPAEFVHKPEALANQVYAGRMGNGPPESGDGWLFRGGGGIQCTGRETFTRLARDVGMTPEACAAWVRTIEGAAASACWFWATHGLNALADAWDIEIATRRINGGLNGISERIRLCEAARAALT